MDLDLLNKQWKEFLFTEVFIIKNGFYNKKPVSFGKGKIPFLGATQSNNGITEFYTEEEIEKASKMGHGINHPISKKIFDGNCIAVTNNGSVGYAYYQKVNFSCSHDINPLYLKDYKLNENIAKFLIATIEKQRTCFEYARKWRPMRMKKSKILLPINAQGSPDYAFMEAFMKHKEQERLYKYKQFAKKRLLELQDHINIDELDSREWRGFVIEDIFNVKSGERLTKADMTKGNKPFIGATDSNNGITEFTSNTNNSEDKNVLGVNYNGSVVENFYHPYIAVFSDDVKRLSLKKTEGNKHLYLFVKTQILKQRMKYQYGYKFNAKRMKRQKIMLPVNQGGTPDYEYMENYMKQLEYQKLSRYLSLK